MRLDLNYVPAILICLGGHGLTHAKDALEDPLDQGSTVPTRRPRWGGCSGHVVMVRSCTRGANILASLWCFLGSITEVTKRLMDNIFWVADVGDSRNHVHKIWGIGEVLHGIVHCPPQLIPNEIKYAKNPLHPVSSY
jgi:hypothetical protein